VRKIASLRQPKRRAWRDLTTACIILRDVVLYLAGYVTHKSGAETSGKVVTKISYQRMPFRRATIKAGPVSTQVASGRAVASEMGKPG
jgi:hypothetical protein